MRRIRSASRRAQFAADPGPDGRRRHAVQHAQEPRAAAGRARFTTSTSATRSRCGCSGTTVIATVEQFLSIPAGTQTPATSAGGVVDLESQVRWRRCALVVGRLARGPAAHVGRRRELRPAERAARRATTISSAPTLGVKGALRRDENNITYDLDQYTQGTWDFAPAWSATVGVRHSEVNFDSEDHFITGDNRDDSGEREVRSHLAGCRPRVQGTSVAASVRLIWPGLSDAARARSSRIARMAARAEPRLCAPARSDSRELGAKLQVSSDLTGEVTLFQALTRNEIVVNTNLGRPLDVSECGAHAPQWRGAGAGLPLR